MDRTSIPKFVVMTLATMLVIGAFVSAGPRPTTLPTIENGNGIHDGLPDLTVLNITFSNTFPKEGETVTICATVANFGTADAYNVSVGFFDQFQGGTILIGDTWIDWIPWDPFLGLNIVYTCLDWVAGPEGFHTIIVEADYLHLIDELDEDNNIAMREIYVGPQEPMLPDLMVFDIWFSDPNPNEGEVIDICAEIWNIGYAEAFNVTVHFYDQWGYGIPVLIGEAWIPLVLPGIPEVVCISWVAGPPGEHTIIVKVDPYDTIEELDEGNNEAQMLIWVEGGTPELPDLAVLDIWFSNPFPFEGDLVEICADVLNIGTVEAYNVTVHFYDQWGWNPPVLIGETWLPVVLPGLPEIVCINWIAGPAGEHMITVKVDPYDTIEELDEGNNEASTPIWVESGPSELPDLTVLGIWFSNPNPFEGELVEICADVLNIGTVEAYNVTVHFYDQWGWNPPVLIGETWLPVVLPGLPEIVCIDWIAGPAGEHMITVQVDPYDWIVEMDEENNEAFAPIWVEGEKPGLPDLTVAPADISFSNDMPSEGETVTICAKIHNMGDSTAYDVLVWFTDRFEAVEYPIAEEFIFSLAPGESVEICTDWVAQPSGGHEIIVDVDPLDFIFEFDESNNSAYRIICVCCGGAPYEIFVEAYTFDNDKDGKYDDVVIFVYDSENHMVEGADVYIDGAFFGKTPVSGTLIAYNFTEGWHDVGVYYETYHAVTTFYSEGL